MPSHTHTTKQIEFFDNRLLLDLIGPQDKHLMYLEKKLNVQIALRGNILTLTGEPENIKRAERAIDYLHQKLQKQQVVDIAEVEAAVRILNNKTDIISTEAKMVDADSELDELQKTFIQTKRRQIYPRTKKQADYIQAMHTHDMVFGIGPAGTGKTYLAVAKGVSLLLSGKIERIILSRPAVEAGEHLGFLPGDMREKVDPYLRPLYDALNDMLPADQVARYIASNEIEIAPLAFMRGRTLSDAFVILDEAQNTTTMQMKMFLTRLGSNSQMVINGDLTQIDLPRGVTSGLSEAMNVLRNIDEINFTIFTEADVVRHPLVSRIVNAYDKHTN